MIDVLGRLEQLRELDPDAAREIEMRWPLTFAAITNGDDEATILNVPLWRCKQLIGDEIDEALAAHDE